jgi:Dullard-like phosphatase family protein
MPPTLRLNVKLRPHLEEALSYLSNMYEICVFTAGEQDYADTILDYIDMDRSIIKHRLYRHHCVKPDSGVYVKDLSIIKDRNLKDMMLVDNSIISFAFHLSNGIPIKAFLGDKPDDELLYMVTYLEEVFTETDVRTSIDTTFQLKSLSEKYGMLTVKNKKEERRLMKDAHESLLIKNADGTTNDK